MNSILVPVDFSTCSTNALNYAIELAKMTSAKLTLLNFYNVHVTAGEVGVDLHPQLSYDLEKKAQNNFKTLKAQVQGLNEVEHEELIEMNFINAGILNHIEEIPTDLVIMGTKGASNRIDAFFGSNTYSTIKKSPIPVLAVPGEATFQPMKKILFAADFKYIKDIHSLEMIKTLANLFKAEIQIIHIGEGWAELNMHQTEEAAAIVEYFGPTEHSYHFVKKELEVEEAIENHITEHHNELLVLIARKHYFPGSLFKKKLTRRTVLQTKIPLLTIPDIR